MSTIKNYIDYLSKEKGNKNYPKTPCIKNNHNNKENRIPINNSKTRTDSIKKKKFNNINSKSKQKYKIYSNSIIDQENTKNKNDNMMFKDFCSKNNININACNNVFRHKNNNSLENILDINHNYSNISSNNFYSKKINDILNNEIPTKVSNPKINTDGNHNNYINKTPSSLNNNNLTNTSKNNKNAFSKKNINIHSNNINNNTVIIIKLIIIKSAQLIVIKIIK